jgi:hypothetical protein
MNADQPKSMVGREGPVAVRDRFVRGMLNWNASTRRVREFVHTQLLGPAGRSHALEVLVFLVDEGRSRFEMSGAPNRNKGYCLCGWRSLLDEQNYTTNFCRPVLTIATRLQPNGKTARNSLGVFPSKSTRCSSGS